jgi:hypothetical protein
LIPAFAAVAAFALAGCGDDASMDPGPDPDPDPDPGGPPTYEAIATFAGTGMNGLTPDGIDPLQTEFSLPQDLAWGPDGKVYLLDWNNHRVRTITGGVIQTVVGTGELGDAPDGVANQIRLNHPTHVSFDPLGRMIVSAWHNSKIMRMDPATGMIQTFCGNGNRTYSGDGGPAVDAEVDLPVATAWATNGDMYFTDEASVRIRKIDANGIVTTFAGKGRPGGFSGDGGLAAQADINLQWGQSAPPMGRLVISGDDLYFADTMNSVVRRINLSTTIIETIAGTPGVYGFAGDGGPATAAQLFFPCDVDVDNLGNVYIADTFNNRIRRVTTDGNIETLVGNGVAPTAPGLPADVRDGVAKEAWLDRPYGIALDANQKLYVADTHNHRIRVVY